MVKLPTCRYLTTFCPKFMTAISSISLTRTASRWPYTSMASLATGTPTWALIRCGARRMQVTMCQNRSRCPTIGFASAPTCCGIVTGYREWAGFQRGVEYIPEEMGGLDEDFIWKVDELDF